MANNFAEINGPVQTALQGACCFDQCPTLQELEDNQFLALIYYTMIQVTGIDPAAEATAEQIKTANNDAWCVLNMDTLCSFPPDKLKAMILYLANEALA